MDITRLFVGIVMLFPVAMVLNLVARADTWRGAVSALHLNWEREQRQSAPNQVPFTLRQSRQARFEELVTGRPIRVLWVHIVMTVAAIAFGFTLAWRTDDLLWIGLWLVIPFGLVAIVGSALTLWQMNSASDKLAAISTSLYGPAPPRVKVKSIQVQDADSQP